MMKLFALYVFFTQVFPHGVALGGQKSGIEIDETFIKENRGGFQYPDTDIEQKEKSLDRQILRKRILSKQLAAIKYEIINGNFEKAKLLLTQAQASKNFTRPIQYRYLAILHFIEGDYKQSLEYLNKKEMLALAHQDNVCLLRTLNHVILDQAAQAQEEWDNCKKFIIGKSVSGNVWMDSLTRLKVAQRTDEAAEPLKGVNIENEQGDYLRLFLKLA
ncbi:MAG: hypothetical protein WEB87_02830, partial [Bacteriovoracaceae bacterium]